jgi:hypothetical protein
MIVVEVGAGAQFCNDLAVDLHPAFEDELLGLAAAGKACCRENLLEALAPGLGGFGHLSIIP